MSYCHKPSNVKLEKGIVLAKKQAFYGGNPRWRIVALG